MCEFFIKLEEKTPSDLIEIHNRPNYLSDIVNTLGKKNLVKSFREKPKLNIWINIGYIYMPKTMIKSLQNIFLFFFY